MKKFLQYGIPYLCVYLNQNVPINGKHTNSISKIRKLLFSLLLFLIMIFLLFAGAEIILRICNRSSKQMINYVTHRGYYTYPAITSFNFINEDSSDILVETDEHGLRNPPGTLSNSDVIILGDSFITAVNTPQDKTLVTTLRKKYGIKAYNAGMDGYSTFRALYLLQYLLDNVQPKVVVLAFYLGNDFHDNYFASPNLSIKEISPQNAAATQTNLALWVKDLMTALCKSSYVCKYCFRHFYLDLTQI